MMMLTFEHSISNVLALNTIKTINSLQIIAQSTSRQEIFNKFLYGEPSGNLMMEKANTNNHSGHTGSTDFSRNQRIPFISRSTSGTRSTSVL